MAPGKLHLLIRFGLAEASSPEVWGCACTVMLAWAQPSWPDWVILPVTEQDNHINKYSPHRHPPLHGAVLHYVHTEASCEFISTCVSKPKSLHLLCPYSYIDSFPILAMKDAQTNTCLVYSTYCTSVFQREFWLKLQLAFFFSIWWGL